MNRPALCLSALVIACIAAACGQSGPLYLPGDPSEMRTPADAATGIEDDEKGPTQNDDDNDEKDGGNEGG